MLEDLTKLSIKELRSRAQSTAPEAGREPYIGHTIRFFSIYITKIFLYTSITPNQMTSLSVLVFLSGISMFLNESMMLQLLGCFLIYFSVVLDGCDGELARLRGNKSGVGQIYTEPISHDIQYSLMFIPFSVGLFLQGLSAWILLVGYIATIGKLVQRFLITRFDAVRVQTHKGGKDEMISTFNPNVSLSHKIYRFLNRNFLSSASFVIPLFGFVILGRIDLFLYMFAVVYSGMALLHFTRQVRFISSLSKG